MKYFILFFFFAACNLSDSAVDSPSTKGKQTTTSMLNNVTTNPTNNGVSINNGESTTAPIPVVAYCGNNILDEGEECDGDIFSSSCQELAGDAFRGELKCSPTCKQETSTCFVAYSQVDTGPNHSCAIQINGKMVCWGRNLSGESDPPPQNTGFQKVGVGRFFSCGLDGDGQIICWGDRTYNSGKNIFAPQGNITAFDTGQIHGCIIEDERVKCWGDDVCQYGYGRPVPNCQPDNVAFKDISGGSLHTCGLSVDDEIYCWGKNDAGERIPPPGTFRQISAGWETSCAIDYQGLVRCWGGRDRSQKNVPNTPDGVFLQVSAGLRWGCGIRENKEIACWEFINPSGVPLEGIPKGKFKQVSASYQYFCAIDIRGKLSCWGENAYGEPN